MRDDTFVPLDPDAQLGYLLALVGDQQARAWQRALRVQGINPRQFSMLATLAHHPGISQGELARRVMVTPQSASESLARLVAAGLVSREKAVGRSARVTLTDAGRAMLAESYPVVEQFNREAFAALTEKERAELTRLLGKLNPNRC